VGRIRWFIAGAAAGAGALVATPDVYRRLRTAVEAVAPPPELPPGAPDTPATEVPPELDDRARDEPELTDPGAVESEDTAELRVRIDETRARIHEKAHAPGREPGTDA
jgi:hypothetical protein